MPTIDNYPDFFENQINSLKSELKRLEKQKNLLKLVGTEAAIVGDFSEDAEFHRIVTIGDEVYTKYGDKGVIVSFNFQRFNERGHLTDIAITYKKENGELDTLDASRFN